MRSPFKFLEAYSLEDKEVFFGREKETDRLYEMVNQNRLVLIYGQSGAGKTSLVECGLANKFDPTDWLPVRIRRRGNINQSLTDRLQQIIKKENTSIEDHVKVIFKNFLRPVYLIFDQLEEVFILGKQEEQQQFIETIATLLTPDVTCRILFLIREEYLGHLYNFEQEIPTLFDRRLRVEAMNAAKVKTVLEKSFSKFKISVESPVQTNLDKIISNLSGGKAIIQLPYLQVYLDMFYREDYHRTYGAKEVTGSYLPIEFTGKEIDDFGDIETVLGKFLDYQEQEIQSILATRHSNMLDTTVLQVMDAFVTDEGTKRPLAFTRAQDEIQIDDKVKRLFPPINSTLLSDSFEEMEKARIIRFQDDYMELAHDSLAALITQKRGEEQKLRKRLAAALDEYELSSGAQLLSETQLLTMSELLPKLYLDKATTDFIQTSKDKIAADKIAAKIAHQKEVEEQRKQAEQERQLREKAEKAQLKAVRNESKAKRRAQLAFLFSTLAIIAALVASRQYMVAEEQKLIAEVEQKNAENAEKVAIEEERKAKQAYRALDSTYHIATETNYKNILNEAREQVRKKNFEGATSSLSSAISFVQNYNQGISEKDISKTVDTISYEQALSIQESIERAPQYISNLSLADSLVRENKFLESIAFYSLALKTNIQTKSTENEILKVLEKGIQYYERTSEKHLTNGTAIGRRIAAEVQGKSVSLRSRVEALGISSPLFSSLSNPITN